MTMNDILLLKQGEIVLKGHNRREFENRLLANIKRRLGPPGSYRIYAMQSTIYVEPRCENDNNGNRRQDGAVIPDLDAALEAAANIFGIVSVTRAAACAKDKDAIVKTAADYLGDKLKTAKTFKVESKRSDKTFPMSSVELSQYVGGELHDLFPNLTPDMHSPELLINVEIRDLAAYVHGPAKRGAGGLPVGTGGRMAALLSGGIDSPVALYLMAKRGVQIYPVHFYSHPYTSLQAKEKVIRLTGLLGRYCGHMNLTLVPFTRIQEAIHKNCPKELSTIITRRFMTRIAGHIAEQHDCTAIITGDNLGQVASQTAQALAVCEQCVSIPVFRPLLAFDKSEIIQLAREIGTFDTSILPFEDCCTVFTPRRPRTKPKLSEVLAAEAALNVDGLIKEALRDV